MLVHNNEICKISTLWFAFVTWHLCAFQLMYVTQMIHCQHYQIVFRCGKSNCMDSF